MTRFLLVCLGGAIGTAVRYLVGLWTQARLGLDFPYGTLIVNLVGCFAIALVMSLALAKTSFPPDLRFFLTSGVMGGLTTYSSFNYESSSMIENGAASTAALYVSLTLAGCALAGVLGLVAGRYLAR